MRIISGIAGGIRLNAPEGRSIRPTEDRVKESIFSTLGNLEGKIVVDMFSGTGALGLEALSRGAACVFSIEYERKHIAYIEQNANAVRKAMGDSFGIHKIICADAKQTPLLLREYAGKIDYILADPPYAEKPDMYGPNALLQDARLAEWAGSQCILMLEHSSDLPMLWHPYSRWTPLKEKNYGIRAVSFAKLVLN